MNRIAHEAAILLAGAEPNIGAASGNTPLQIAAVIRLPFKAGVGMFALLGEVNRLFLSRNSGAVLWMGLTHPPFDIADMEARSVSSI